MLKVKGKKLRATRANEIPATPFYEPFYGWFVAEGWTTRDNDGRAEGLVIIYHKVGEVGVNTPAHPPKWDKIDGFDLLKYV